MADGRVVYEIDGDNSKFKSAVDQSKSVASKGWEGISTAGKAAFAAVGAAAVAAGAAIINVAKDSIAQYAEFEQLVGGVETLFGAGGRAASEYTNDYIDKTTKRVQEANDELRDYYKNGAMDWDAWFQHRADVEGVNLSKMTTKEAEELRLMYVQEAGELKKYFGLTSDEIAKMADASYNDVMEAQDAVMLNAQNAWKTAGLSANDYMSTVTSFSAALLASTDSHAEAAKIADMAVVDMADNANKMGTSMESIQNAYQGFAKQNYTMLDNLKLGYGGTKTEMERLLQDAEKIHQQTTGEVTHYSINNLSDVYQAIHDVQTELGITGTTAKEAESTIQGSFSQMKAAWDNLVTGMADENANLDSLLNDFVDSVFTVLENVIPRIETLLPRLVEGIVSLVEMLIPELAPILESLAPALIDGITALIQGLVEVLPTVLSIAGELAMSLITALADGLSENLDAILEASLEIFKMLMETLITAAPQLIDAAVELITSLCDFLIDNIDWVIDTTIQLFEAIMTALIENAPKLLKAAWELIKALIEGIVNAIPKVLESIGKLFVEGILNPILSKMSTMLQQGKDLIGKVIEGIKNKISDIKNAVRDVIDQAKQKIRDKITEFRNIGKDLLQGLINGIKDKVSAAVQAVKDAVGKVISGAKSLLGINSPSKVFRVIGEFVDEGLEEGIADYSNLPVNATKSMVNRIVDNGYALNAPAIALAGATSGGTVSNQSFTIAKLADNISVRSDRDIDAISNALYQRILMEKRSRGLVD